MRRLALAEEVPGRHSVMWAPDYVSPMLSVWLALQWKTSIAFGEQGFPFQALLNPRLEDAGVQVQTYSGFDTGLATCDSGPVVAWAAG